MQFKPVSDLYHAAEKNEAWIFGKGPGIEDFDSQLAGSIRICINESVNLVDNPTHFFAHDEAPIRRVTANWPAGCLAILEQERAEFAVKCGITRDDIFVYNKKTINSPGCLPKTNGIFGEDDLVGITGTVHSAIHFSKLLGAESIKLVGFEGCGGYAKSLDMDVPLGGGRHAQIRRDTIGLLNRLKLDFEFLQECELDSGKTVDRESFAYEDLYNKLRERDYHDPEDETSHMASFIGWIVDNIKPNSVLDIGCSAGKSLELFSENGVVATGVEISSIAVQKAQSLGRNVVQGCATSLPFEDNSFDLVCSADVFEHLHPDDAEKACQEACRVARKHVFLKIAEKEDATEKWKEIAGHPLHLTTKPIGWWKQWCIPFGRTIRLEHELICLDVGSQNRLDRS